MNKSQKLAVALRNNLKRRKKIQTDINKSNKIEQNSNVANIERMKENTTEHNNKYTNK